MTSIIQKEMTSVNIIILIHMIVMKQTSHDCYKLVINDYHVIYIREFMTV